MKNKKNNLITGFDDILLLEILNFPEEKNKQMGRLIQMAISIAPC